MLGRIPSSLSKVREMPLSSKQMGNRTNKVTNVEGRVVFDVIQVSWFMLIFMSIAIIRYVDICQYCRNSKVVNYKF